MSLSITTLIRQFSISLLWLPVAAQAVIMPNFFETTHWVSSEQAEARQDAMAMGIDEVLLHLTSAPQQWPAWTSQQLTQWVTQYQYTTLNQHGERALEITWDEQAIEQWLTEQQIPWWDAHRPVVLLWGRCQTDQGDVILSQDGRLSESLKDTANQWGVPLVLPMMDLMDLSHITSADIAGQFLDRIYDASARYAPDIIVIAQLQESVDDHWMGHYTILWPEASRMKTQTILTPPMPWSDHVKHTLTHLAAALRAYYQASLHQSSWRASTTQLTLNIQMPTDMDSFMHMQQQLTELDVIDHFDIVATAAGEIRIDIDSTMRPSAITQSLLLNEHFVLIGEPELQSLHLQYIK